MSKIYTDTQWAFIRDYEEQAPELADFFVRLRAHEATLQLADYGMAAEDIRRIEDESGDGQRMSAEDAVQFLNQKFFAEEVSLVHNSGLRARSEAAWRMYRLLWVAYGIGRIVGRLSRWVRR